VAQTSQDELIDKYKIIIMWTVILTIIAHMEAFQCYQQSLLLYMYYCIINCYLENNEMVSTFHYKKLSYPRGTM